MNRKGYIAPVLIVVLTIIVGASSYLLYQHFAFSYSFEICSPGDMFGGTPEMCVAYAENEGREDCIFIKMGGDYGVGTNRACHSRVQCVVKCGVKLAPENTKELCSDGIDNNGDSRVDTRDPRCAEFRVPPPPKPPVPVISDITVKEITNSTVVIEWQTNHPGRSAVHYNSSQDWNTFIQAFPDNDALVTNHRVKLINLKPGTTYYYWVRSDSEISSVRDISSIFNFNTNSVNQVPSVSTSSSSTYP